MIGLGTTGEAQLLGLQPLFEGIAYEMSAKTGRLCPCGSGLPGRRQWSQGCPDKIACPACFVRTRERTPTAPISGKRDQRNAIARRKLEELRELKALSDS